MEREIIEKSSAVEGFREEVRNWVETEMKKKKAWEEQGETGEQYDAHADFIRPELLNETDLEIWKKIKNETVTQEDMVAYDQKFNQETAFEPPDVTQAREEFKALMINKSIPILVRKSKEK